MKDLLIFLVMSVVSSEGRLIQINRTKVEEQQTDKPNPSIRLTRDIEEILMGFSNEQIAQSDEFVRSPKRPKDYKKYNLNGKLPQSKITRYARDSIESTKKPNKVLPQKAPERDITEKEKKNLVRKPIPKFGELDYEDDFQAKMNRFLSAVIESGEHEDEDFSVDDYDFDVNHDEYSGRGKPLEPRLNLNKPGYAKSKSEPKGERKMISNLINLAKSQSKKGRSANYDLPSKNREIDYDYELTTVKTITKPKVSLENDYEDDDSIDFDRKNSSIRRIRSWNMAKSANKFSGKSSVNLVKYLSILPLFPQMSFDLEEMDDLEYAANGNVVEPVPNMYIF